MEWISVKDRMPEDGRRVLCWNNQQHTQTIQVYNEEYGCWDAEDGDDSEYSCKSETISHWCYMPGNPNK